MTEVRSELHGRLATVAVTGTNGKTTTTGMVESIVAAAGEPHARVTTLGSWVQDQQLAEGTTLEAFAVALERAVEVGVRTLALEVTSRALGQGFAQRWPARVAVFTNLSRDHLDTHGDAEHYLAAKAQLFMTLPEDGAAVLNAADPASALLDEVTPPGARRWAFAVDRALIAPACRHLPLALCAAGVSVSRAGTQVALAPSPLAGELGGALALGVIGEHNAENALAAALAAHALGYPASAIAAGLSRFGGVRGRFEVVCEQPLAVVDYAHTPDALARTLALARRLAGSGRVICVFGCGGGSDPGKRPEMGRAAALHADVVVVTSDNPRQEDPAAIAAAVLEGARAARGGEGAGADRRITSKELCLISELDRAAAITRAMTIARENQGDIVVVAGKGHETTQWIGEQIIPFDDARVVRAACRAGQG